MKLIIKLLCCLLLAIYATNAFAQKNEKDLEIYALLFYNNLGLVDTLRYSNFQQLARQLPNSGKYGLYAQSWLSWKKEGARAGLAQVEKLIEKYPAFAPAYCLRAEIKLNIEKNDPFILADIDKALSLSPGLAYAHLLKAQYYELQQRYGDALKEINLCWSKDSALWQNIARTEFYILKQYGKHEDAFQLAKRVLKKSPNFAPAFAWISELALENQKQDTALFFIEQALRIAPQNYDFLKQKLKTQLALRLYAAAEKTGDTLINLHPELASGYYWRGKARYARQIYPLALQDFTQALNFLPDDTAALLARAQTKYNLKDPQGAIEDFSKILVLDPQHYDARRFRATLRMAIGENENALQDFNFLIQNKPQIASLYSDRGVIRRRLGDIEGALKDYAKALEINPQDFGVYNNRAFLLAQLNRNAEAIEDYNKALLIKPGFVFSLNNRGQLKEKIGDWNGAIQDFTEVIKQERQNANAYFLRGRCKMQIFDTQGACQDWKVAARYGHPEAAKIFAEKCRNKN
jgi:tetratricopeptide (TPR) repeat protein